jgi:hypothetical protein
MPARLRTALVVACLTAFTLLPVAVGSAATARETAEAPLVSPARYLTDVQTATSALRRFGNRLRATDNLAEFRSVLPRVRSDLRGFDRSIRRLRGYRLANSTLNAQRGNLARTGPPLARTLSSFLDAVADLERERVNALTRQLTSGLRRFQRAAQG